MVCIYIYIYIQFNIYLADNDIKEDEAICINNNRSILPDLQINLGTLFFISSILYNKYPNLFLNTLGARTSIN